MEEPGIFSLIREAREMLLDRPKKERDLIYAIAKLEQDLRAAIILAYQNIKSSEESDA